MPGEKSSAMTSLKELATDLDTKNLLDIDQLSPVASMLKQPLFGTPEPLRRPSSSSSSCASPTSALKKSSNQLQEDADQNKKRERESTDDEREGNKENIHNNVLFSCAKKKRKDSHEDQPETSTDEWTTPRVPLGPASSRSRRKSMGRSMSSTGKSATSGGERKSSDTKYRGAWTKEEDERLILIVKRRGACGWTAIAQELDSGRNGRQCRERWSNQINPDLVRSNWTAEEDALILKLHSEVGNKWATIAKHLPGRTDNMVKNRYNGSLLPRQTRERRQQAEKRKPQGGSGGRKGTPSLRNKLATTSTTLASTLVSGASSRPSTGKRDNEIVEPQEEMLSPAARLYGLEEGFELPLMNVDDGNKTRVKRNGNNSEESDTISPGKATPPPKLPKLSPFSTSSQAFPFSEFSLETPKFDSKGSKKNLFDDFSPLTEGVLNDPAGKKQLKLSLPSDGDLHVAFSGAFPGSPALSLKLSPVAQGLVEGMLDTPKTLTDLDFGPVSGDRKRRMLATPVFFADDDDKLRRIVRPRRRNRDADSESLLGDDVASIVDEVKTPVARKKDSSSSSSTFGTPNANLGKMLVEPLRTGDDLSQLMPFGTPNASLTLTPNSTNCEIMRHYQENLGSIKKPSNKEANSPSSKKQQENHDQDLHLASNQAFQDLVKDATSEESQEKSSKKKLSSSSSSKAISASDLEEGLELSSAIFFQHLQTPKNATIRSPSKLSKQSPATGTAASTRKENNATAADGDCQTEDEGDGIDLSKHAPCNFFGDGDYLARLVSSSQKNAQLSSAHTPRSLVSNKEDDLKSISATPMTAVSRTSSSRGSMSRSTGRSARAKTTSFVGPRASDEKWGVSDIPCKCKKTRCLKLYCTCFSSQNFCSPTCQCVECSNAQGNEDWLQVASSIPSRTSPGNRKESPFCKCKNSMCLKKYCDCFRSNVRCGPTCVCVDCHNTDEHMEKLASKSSFTGPTTKARTPPLLANVKKEIAVRAEAQQA